MRSFLLRALFGGVIAAGVFGYQLYDRAVNYEPATVRVTNVEQLCYLEKKERRRRRTRTYRSDVAPCHIVQYAAKTDPEFEGFELQQTQYVSYTYRSPVDGEWYQGRHEQMAKDDGSAIRPGDEISVLVSVTDPTETQAH